jgi:hypothetical protein
MCENVRLVGSHCNCGGNEDSFKFSIEKGMSKGSKSSSSVSETTSIEVRNAIKVY